MKTCIECRKQFEPAFPRQQRCTHCIMILQPEITSQSNEITTDFGEWFIYNWRNIRKAANVKFGAKL